MRQAERSHQTSGGNNEAAGCLQGPRITELFPLSLFIKALLDYTPTIRLSGKQGHNMDLNIPEHTIIQWIKQQNTQQYVIR